MPLAQATVKVSGGASHLRYVLTSLRLDDEPQGLVGCWPQILPCGPLHGAACNMELTFPRVRNPRERLREGKCPRLKSQSFYN